MIYLALYSVTIRPGYVGCGRYVWWLKRAIVVILL